MEARPLGLMVMPEEKAAAERLRQMLHLNRMHSNWERYRDDDIGLLLCAVGRINFMENKAEGIAQHGTGEAQAAARLILGWTEDTKHG